MYMEKGKASVVVLEFKSWRSDNKYGSYGRLCVNNFFPKNRNLDYGRALMG